MTFFGKMDIFQQALITIIDQLSRMINVTLLYSQDEEILNEEFSQECKNYLLGGNLSNSNEF